MELAVCVDGVLALILKVGVVIVLVRSVCRVNCTNEIELNKLT